MRLSVSFELSATERLALERALYHRDRPSLLQSPDAEDWAERVLRWRLREMVASAGLDNRPTRIVQMEEERTRDQN